MGAVYVDVVVEGFEAELLLLLEEPLDEEPLDDELPEVDEEVEPLGLLAVLEADVDELLLLEDELLLLLAAEEEPPLAAPLYSIKPISSIG